MFMSDEKKSLRELLDNLSTEIQTLRFTKGELKVWKDGNGTVNFELLNGLIIHYAQITILENGEPRWLCTVQNF